MYTLWYDVGCKELINVYFGILYLRLYWSSWISLQMLNQLLSGKGAYWDVLFWEMIMNLEQDLDTALPVDQSTWFPTLTHSPSWGWTSGRGPTLIGYRAWIQRPGRSTTLWVQRSPGWGHTSACRCPGNRPHHSTASPHSCLSTEEEISTCTFGIQFT